MKREQLKRKKNIIIVGLGGVGGYFGFKINQRNERDQHHHVSFVARGETFEQVKANGLTLLSPEVSSGVTRADAVYAHVRELTDPDLILLCIKGYDLENVCRGLRHVITNDTILLPMMNGVDIYERIRAIIPDNILLPSCVYVASHIKEKGIVAHSGRGGRLIFGRDPEHFTADIDWVVDLIRDSSVEVTFKDHSLVDIWTKFVFIASFGLVTAKYNSSIGAVCTDALQHREAAAIMEEIVLIAQKKEIHLHENIIEWTFDNASTFPPLTPTSLQLDVNSGKSENELELFAGAIIRYGAALNIKTLQTEKIYEEILAVGNMRDY